MWGLLICITRITLDAEAAGTGYMSRISATHPPYLLTSAAAANSLMLLPDVLLSQIPQQISPLDQAKVQCALSFGYHGLAPF